MEQWPVDRIRDAIERHTGRSGRRQGREWRLICPTHPDREPSLQLRETEEHVVLMVCMGNCDTRDVLAAVGLTMRDMYPVDPDDRRRDPVVATYTYVDEDGNLLFQVERTVAKKFRQRRPDPDKPGRWVYNLDGVRRVLYHLPALIQAVREAQTVYVVEGEKDVHSIEALGQVATCNPGGAGKWRPEYSEVLAGAHVVVVEDNDQARADGKMPGHEHALQIVADLNRVGALVTHVRPKVGKDITDHLTAGVELDDTLIVPPDIPTTALESLPGQAEAIDDTLGEAPTYVPDAVVGKELRITPATAYGMRAARWIWADRIPRGEICLIAGREGVGKSTFLAWMAAQITRGTLPGEYYGQPRAVFYCAAEDAWDYTIAPRMHAAGADLNLVYRLEVWQPELGITEKLILPNHVSLLPDKAREYKAAILMCDPILSNLNEKLNPNLSRELRMALEPLRDAAEKAQIAVAALVHFNKTRDTDAGSMIAGSRAWMEVARAALAIARKEEEGEEPVQVLTQIKNSFGRLDQPSLQYQLVNHQISLDDGEELNVGRVEWLEEHSLDTAEQILQRRQGHQPDRSGMARTTAAVLDFLDEQTMAVSPRQVSDALPNIVNHANARQLLNRLAARGEIEKIGTGLYRALQPSQSPRAHRHAPVHARAGAPLGVTSHTHTQIRGGKGGDGVTGVTRDSDTVGGEGEGVTPTLFKLIACRVCFGPLDVVEPGQTAHPLCEEADELL